jgi:hypothetical protein
MSHTGGSTHQKQGENCKRDTNVTQKGRGSNKRNSKTAEKNNSKNTEKAMIKQCFRTEIFANKEIEKGGNGMP